MLYAQLVLPVPLDTTYTYAVPAALEAKVQVGMRALVPFGKSHRYTGIIVSLTPHAPTDVGEIRAIEELPDPGPVLRQPQYALWQWMAQYYMCPIGDVMKAALPSELKPEEGAKGTVRADFRPKMRTMVTIQLTDQLQPVFDQLHRSPQQLALYMKLLDMSHVLQKGTADAVPKDELLRLAGVGTAIFNQLKAKGLLTTHEVEVSRLDTADRPWQHETPQPPSPLSPAQKTALHDIAEALTTHQVCLLHGVTSSGKTEVYIHLMQQVIEQGRQVLMLVPEIALTTQLCQRLRRVFGSKMLVYHSQLADHDRTEIWRRMAGTLPGESPGQAPQLILGVRSAVFLPFHQLGLVVVDEEHEASYKQQDPSPRYHGRDVAIVLAQHHGAKVVLGSATPSLESYWLAQQGKYGYVTLTERHGGVRLPEVQLVQRSATDVGGLYTPELLGALRHTLADGKQAMLFQNRRGYSPITECVQCGWSPKCPRCDVSLSYHRATRRLHCHYCDYQMPWPPQCPQCGNPKLELHGYGTERIEESLQQALPTARPLRMDTDAATSRRAYERILDDFAQHRANILIGTQMITKGLDFDDVQTVGILNADSMLNQPDFRAHERAFQLMEQVAGRAGRREGQTGRVLIQCANPRHPVLRQVLHHDYLAMVNAMLTDRQRYGYPPFTRLIMIYMKGRYEDRLDTMARQYAERLRQVFGTRVLGPEAPPVARVRSMFVRQILLKVERQASTAEVRRCLLAVEHQMRTDVQAFARMVFYYDVDPV